MCVVCVEHLRMFRRLVVLPLFSFLFSSGFLVLEDLISSSKYD